MQDSALPEQRLDDLSAAMRRLPADALVYYEDAGFYQRELSRLVRDRLLDRIDVYGMNEDELQEYLARPVDLLSPHDVTAALTEVHALIPARALVVHTKYWAIAVGPASGRHREALKSAVMTAANRYVIGYACIYAGTCLRRVPSPRMRATWIASTVAATRHDTDRIWRRRRSSSGVRNAATSRPAKITPPAECSQSAIHFARPVALKTISSRRK